MTHQAERWFGTWRARVSRLVPDVPRRADSFSKNVERHLDAIHLFIITHHLKIQQATTA